jgi:hypothetical protein
LVPSRRSVRNRASALVSAGTGAGTLASSFHEEVVTMSGASIEKNDEDLVAHQVEVGIQIAELMTRHRCLDRVRAGERSMRG